MDKEKNILLLVVVLVVIILIVIIGISFVLLTSNNDSDDDAGLIEPEEENDEENAAVTVSVTNDNTIKITLAVGGAAYDQNMGYSSDDIMIYIDGMKVTGITGSWFVGGSWIVDSDNAIAGENPTGFESGAQHDVTVAIMDTVIFSGTIEIP